MTERDSIIHLIAGGVAGTAGAVVTCPLEVVKTRLQSSNAFLPTNRPFRSKELSGIPSSLQNDALRPEQRRKFSSTILRRIRPQRSSIKTFLRKNLTEKIRLNFINVYAISHCGISSAPKSMSILQCLRHIVQNEGTAALFKGLGPNLVGVAPSRAIYFCTYSQTKEALSSMGISIDSPYSHIMSAMCAGFVSSTSTNPIWFVKTRLQLDFNSEKQMTVRDCIRNIYQTSGLRGFYKGITASYFGISETVVHFVIYETLKRKLVEFREKRPEEGKSTRDFLEFMACGAFSKTIASCIAYPHEVARTRLRETGNKYHAFWQTLFLVWKEEGKAGLYRGLATQLVRQIPNTAIMMATYEAVVYVLSMKFNATFYLDSHQRNGNGKSSH